MLKASEIATLSAAIGQDTRARALEVLSREGPLNGKALAHWLGLSAGTLYHHMGFLTSAGLVIQQRLGQGVLYLVNGPKLEELGAWLDEQARLSLESFQNLSPDAPTTPQEGATR